jgi:hypothetical protein
MEALNFAHLNNQPIRVMYSNRDPSSRRSGSANIFIKVPSHLFNLHCHLKIIILFGLVSDEITLNFLFAEPRQNN